MEKYPGPGRSPEQSCPGIFPTNRSATSLCLCSFGLFAYQAATGPSIAMPLCFLCLSFCFFPIYFDESKHKGHEGATKDAKFSYLLRDLCVYLLRGLQFDVLIHSTFSLLFMML
jgi:hypothetical protein